MRAATPAEKIKIIWFEPESPSSLKTNTLKANALTKKRIGSMASQRLGLRIEIVCILIKGKCCKF
jgi:hypothetical protein